MVRLIVISNNKGNLGRANKQQILKNQNAHGNQSLGYHPWSGRLNLNRRRKQNGSTCPQIFKKNNSGKSPFFTSQKKVPSKKIGMELESFLSCIFNKDSLIELANST